MKKSEKFVMVFCLLFFLTSLISFSQQKKISKDPNPVPPDQGKILCEDPLIDQAPPMSPRSRSRHSRRYCGMVAGDYDGDGYDEVAFDFGASGIWIYDPNAASAWHKISKDDPVWMIAVYLANYSDAELLVCWASGHSPENSWWNYSGYPGAWQGISGSVMDYAYDGGDINGDGDDEVVVQWDTLGIYVCNYTGSGTYGGFDIYKISSTEAEGMAASFGASDYEPLHSFSDGTKYWNYSSGYPSSNWFSINSSSFDAYDSVVADIDDGGADEFMADILGQLWLYDHDTTSWTRYNYNNVCEMYPVAYIILDEQYEFLVRFCGNSSLWSIDPGYSWQRVSWNTPNYVLGANFRTNANGGNSGEEAVADFGASGVWYQLTYAGGWTRINWNNPDSMIKANLDADPEMEIVFDFGNIGLGVYVWDGATGSGTWTRINYGNPESGTVGDGCAGCER